MISRENPFSNPHSGCFFYRSDCGRRICTNPPSNSTNHTPGSHGSSFGPAASTRGRTLFPIGLYTPWTCRNSHICRRRRNIVYHSPDIRLFAGPDSRLMGHIHARSKRWKNIFLDVSGVNRRHWDHIYTRCGSPFSESHSPCRKINRLCSDSKNRGLSLHTTGPPESRCGFNSGPENQKSTAHPVFLRKWAVCR